PSGRFFVVWRFLSLPAWVGAWRCCSRLSVFGSTANSQKRYPSPALPFAVRKGGGASGFAVAWHTCSLPLATGNLHPPFATSNLLPPFAAGKGRAGEGSLLSADIARIPPPPYACRENPGAAWLRATGFAVGMRRTRN